MPSPNGIQIAFRPLIFNEHSARADIPPRALPICGYAVPLRLDLLCRASGPPSPFAGSANPSVLNSTEIFSAARAPQCRPSVSNILDCEQLPSSSKSFRSASITQLAQHCAVADGIQPCSNATRMNQYAVQLRNSLFSVLDAIWHCRSLAHGFARKRAAHVVTATNLPARLPCR